MRHLFLVTLAACTMQDDAQSPDSAAAESATSGERAWDALPSSGAGTLVVDLADGTDLETARALTGLPLSWVSPHSADEALAEVQVDDLQGAIAALGELPSVEAVEPTIAFQALSYPDDPLWSKQWNLRKIGAPAGWRVGGGDGVVVAVIDTGVTRVADLADTHHLKGASMVPGSKGAADDNGHGTHVAGTIAQSTNNGVGVAGIAPEATILPIKVLSASGMGTNGWVAAGIDAAVDQGADIINMSLGGASSSVVAVAVEKAQKAGVLVVAAAGNTGRRGVGSPASLPGVIAVSATGPDDELAPYSSYGPEVAIAAPGGNKLKSDGGILQDTVDPGSPDGHAYKSFQGTSMATPHVAGAAAVLWGAGAGGPEEVRELLLSTTNDLGAEGRDERFGHGRLNLAAAVRGLSVERHGLLFGLGGVLALLLATLGGGRWARWKAVTVVTGAASAGGLFFLNMLPLPPSTVVDVLSRPLLLWGDALVPDPWGRSPLFFSAALPLIATFLLGPTRTLGPVVAGIAAGAAAHLLYGAAMGGLQPWLLPGALGTGWLSVNGLVCVVCAMAVIGIRKMRDREE